VALDVRQNLAEEEKIRFGEKPISYCQHVFAFTMHECPGVRDLSRYNEHEIPPASGTTGRGRLVHDVNDL
jgi:hypothetical protein